MPSFLFVCNLRYFFSFFRCFSVVFTLFHRKIAIMFICMTEALGQMALSDGCYETRKIRHKPCHKLSYSHSILLLSFHLTHTYTRGRVCVCMSIRGKIDFLRFVSFTLSLVQPTKGYSLSHRFWILQPSVSVLWCVCGRSFVCHVVYLSILYNLWYKL